MDALAKVEAPPISEELSNEEQQETFRIHGLAHYLANSMAGAYVYTAVSSTIETGHNDIEAYLLYVAQLKKEAGNPKDPIELMLIEQLALAHHNIGRLSMRAANAKTVEETKILEAALARLVSEFRKTAMAIKDFREPNSRKQFTLIKQQNLAQNQQVAYVDSQQAGGDKSAAEDREEASCDSKLGSNRKEAIEHVEQINTLTRPDARGHREEEPVETERADA